MIISQYPSTVLMPKRQKPYPSLLDFLTERFPSIEKKIWEARILSGKVLAENGNPISLDMPYLPLKKLLYFREVEKELVIPFSEKIIFCNDQLLVACKPHFLPVIPGGTYVNQCLLNRLKKRTGNHDLSPINRIDRETAGLVLFSMNPETRGSYQELFMNRKVDKTYNALAKYSGDRCNISWTVENRIIQGEPWFRMKTVPGQSNAISKIAIVETQKNTALFELSPITGKKHQLRLHLSGLGFPILNDRCYPTLLPKKNVDFKLPLQLLAKRIGFKDPLSGKKVTYESERQLVW
jgi:tRNA pseudouridine32 synthase / 23S rRNA pseudouridine746 synthase